MMTRLALAAALLLTAAAASAQVQVKDAWARATLQGQTATGAFMTLTAPDGAKLVGVSSPVAGHSEVHEMVMDGSVMKMRPIAALELPAGRAVELKPGGYHLMLMDLKRALKPGEKVPVELRFETRDRKLITQPLEIDVAARAPGAAPSAAGTAHKH